VALKIVRQPGQIAVIGAPSSAGAHNAGMEKAPAAFRSAGLVERLREAGFTVSDLGDIPTFTCQPDEESPRARNLKNVVAALNALNPQIEIAAKSGALILVLGGECTMALATIAGLRRYYRNVSLWWLDSDADLNVPATTPSGCVHGMALAHIIGRGAPELVRFWGEPPLVREPDVILFGVDRLDAPEAAFLERSAMKRYAAADIVRRGVAAAAQEALARLHAEHRDFVLHLDLDFIAGEDLPSVDFPGTGGIRLDAAREIVAMAASQQHLLAVDIASYNPDKDPSGTDAKKIVDFIVSALSARLALPAPAAVPAASKKHARGAAADAASVVPMPAPAPAGATGAPAVEPEPESRSGDSLGAPPDSADEPPAALGETLPESSSEPPADEKDESSS